MYNFIVVFLHFVVGGCSGSNFEATGWEWGCWVVWTIKVREEILVLVHITHCKKFFLFLTFHSSRVVRKWTDSHWLSRVLLKLWSYKRIIVRNVIGLMHWGDNVSLQLVVGGEEGGMFSRVMLAAAPWPHCSMTCSTRLCCWRSRMGRSESSSIEGGVPEWNGRRV